MILQRLATGLGFLVVAGAMALGLPGDAYSLTVVESNSDFFLGEGGCGSTDEITISTSGRRLRALSPKVGDQLKGDESELVVATITNVTVNRRSVAWTATAAGDVCARPDLYGDGWATEDLSFRTRSKERVYFPSECYDSKIKPRSIIVTCGDGGFRIADARWRRWGGKVAKARATARVNDCVPNCAQGSMRSYRLKVRLRRPRACSKTDRYQYTRLVWEFPGARPGSGYPRRRTENFEWVCNGA